MIPTGIEVWDPTRLTFLHIRYLPFIVPFNFFSHASIVNLPTWSLVFFFKLGRFWFCFYYL